MFFVTYLHRELGRRMRQGVFVALGLALGVGLVVTVAAASAGVTNAQSGVLSGLYGVGTDITVTGPLWPTTHQYCTRRGCEVGPNCTRKGCHGKLGPPPVIQTPLYDTVSASTVAAVTRLHGVAAAAGVLTFVYGLKHAQSGNYTVDGVGTGHSPIGPLSADRVVSGHYFTTADSDADVALVDSVYAAISNLRVGSEITIGQGRFTVIGIVAGPAGTSPVDVYIPLARVQAVGTGAGSLANQVNLIYVAAASAVDVPAVQSEISRLLPGDTVNTDGSLFSDTWPSPSGLASQVTGSLADAAKLANDLGRWVSVLALLAAFAVACLLTMAAVARRSAEFGTLKALGWRTRRITVQVLGESLITGILGAAAGVGVGFAGSAIIAAVAPTLSATDATAIGSMQQVVQNGSADPVASGPVSVPLSPSVTAGVIVLAVLLALAGGLLAGAFGAWRIARLRPASALALVA
jgi:putative ABC transport system permease protein